MYLTVALLAKKTKAKHIMVAMESLVSRHKTWIIRERLAEKSEIIRFDPRIQQDAVYRETKKIKSMSVNYKPKTKPFRPISRFAME